MIKIYKKSLSTVILVLISLILQGCYSTRMGELARLDKINGSEKLSDYTYSIKLVDEPNKDSPQLRLKIQRTPLYDIKAKKIYYEEKYWDNGKLGWLTGVSISALGIAMLSIGGSDFMNVGGIATVIFGPVFGILTGARSDMKGSETGKFLEGKIVDHKETGIVESYPGTKLTLKFKDNEIVYTSDPKGEIIVNLVEDLGLIKFDDFEYISIKAKAIDKRINTEFSLNTKDWTVPFIKVGRELVSVETEKNGNLIKLGEVKKGEEYKILLEGTELIKIAFNGEEGFIPKDAGTKFWAVENYLELKN